MTTDPLVIASMNALPSLPLPGSEYLRGGGAVWLGGGQQDDGVLLLPLHLAGGQAAHGDPVGSSCEVHLTQEIEQILVDNNIRQSPMTLVKYKTTYSITSGLLEGIVFKDDFLRTFLIRNFRHVSLPADLTDLSNSVYVLSLHIRKRFGEACSLSCSFLVVNL